MNYKKISKCIIAYADKRRKYTVEEKMVLQYGTELLLDSVIKIILYLVLGGILGKQRKLFLHCLHGVLYETNRRKTC